MLNALVFGSIYKIWFSYFLGLKVKLLLRDPSKLPSELLDKVEYVKGDVTNAEDVEKTVADVDGVIVVLGTRKNLGKLNI